MIQNSVCGMLCPFRDNDILFSLNCTTVHGEVYYYFCKSFCLARKSEMNKRENGGEKVQEESFVFSKITSKRNSGLPRI